VQRCTVHGIPYDSPENTDSSVEALAAAMHSKAVIEANRAAATLLVHQLTSGSQGAKTVAARGIRLLAKTRRENLAFNADACAIPHLRKLLSCTNSFAQKILYSNTQFIRS
jgi:hypothetical protein